MRLYDDLLGEYQAGRTLDFFGADKENLFVENCKRMPEDWYYKHNKIHYTFNQHGHRSIEIKDLNFDNYILFLGDSHTEGIGLELEKTYPYLVSQKLNIPYYNMGMGGTGVDAMSYNLSIWLSKYPKPKFIFLYYSDMTRFLIKQDTLFTSGGTWSTNPHYQNFLRYADSSGYFVTRYILSSKVIKNLCENNNIPYHNMSFIADLPELDYVNIEKTVDKARDLQHAGIEMHDLLSDYLVMQYSDKYLNASPISTRTVQVSEQEGRNRAIKLHRP